VALLFGTPSPSRISPHVALGRRVDHQAAFVGGDGHRLLANNVAASLGGADGKFAVQVNRPGPPRRSGFFHSKWCRRHSSHSSQALPLALKAIQHLCSTPGGSQGRLTVQVERAFHSLSDQPARISRQAAEISAGEGSFCISRRIDRPFPRFFP
jgi:hypothetical protein